MNKHYVMLLVIWPDFQRHDNTSYTTVWLTGNAQLCMQHSVVIGLAVFALLAPCGLVDMAIESFLYLIY